MKHGNDTTTIAIPLALLMCFPIIQWGASTYLSFQMLCFLILFISIDYRVVATNVPTLVFVALAMSASTLAHTASPFFLHSMLRVWREVFCLFVLLSVYGTRPKYQSDNKSIRMVVTWLALAILISTILQFYFYNFRSSSIFFIPEYFYLAEFKTLAINWAAFAQEHSLNIKIRPSSFYAEPSYLGFISLSLLVIILNIFSENFRKYLLVLILFASLTLSQTTSGLISFGLLLTVFYFNKIRRIHPFVAIELLLLAPVYFLLFPIPDLFLRVFDIGDSQKELSGFIRMVLPFELIVKVWTHSPLGVPPDQLVDFLKQPSVRTIANMFTVNHFSGLQVVGLDNAFLNFFIFYGMLGITILWAFFKKIQNRYLLFYLFLTSFFNGGLLSFDKVAVISTVFLIVNRWRRTAVDGTNGDAISGGPPLDSGIVSEAGG